MIDSQDRAALAEVTSVEGEPIDMEVILAGTNLESGRRLESLHTLISNPESPNLNAAELQAQVESIISNAPYSAGTTQESGWLVRALEFIAEFFDNAASRGIVLAAVIAIVLALAVPVLNRMANRRERSAAETSDEPERPIDYEAAARTASERGELEQAVRLLFLDGAQHLQQSGALQNAATTSTATVRPMTDDDGFLDRFDEIAYGGSRAHLEDVDQARVGWQHLKQRSPSR